MEASSTFGYQTLQNILRGDSKFNICFKPPVPPPEIFFSLKFYFWVLWPQIKKVIPGFFWIKHNSAQGWPKDCNFDNFYFFQISHFLTFVRVVETDVGLKTRFHYLATFLGYFISFQNDFFEKFSFQKKVMNIQKCTKFGWF